MAFVTLDIDEFAHWASRFVPKDYHAKHAFGKNANLLGFSGISLTLQVLPIKGASSFDLMYLNLSFVKQMKGC